MNLKSVSKSITFEEALIAVESLLSKKNETLSSADIFVLRSSWEDKKYSQMGSETYKINYLQHSVAPRLWQLLSKISNTNTGIGKKRVRSFLEEVAKEYYDQSNPKENAEFITKEKIPIKGDRLPSLCNFFGRTEEIDYLKDLTIKQQCIALVGIAGIGKSALAAKVIEGISVESNPNFNCLIWKSIAHGPTVTDLTVELIELIQPQQTIPEYTQGKVSVLLKQMQARRCLIVLDTSNGSFQQDLDQKQKQEYETFFRRIAEEQHQSCLLFLSRSLPRQIENLVEARRIECIKIEGLDPDAARKLLIFYGVTQQEECNDLIQTYRGSPSQLLGVVNRINRYFKTPESFFENRTTLISNELQDMLNKAFQNMSEIQLEVMIYLSNKINSDSKEPIGFNQIFNHLNQNSKMHVPNSELIMALEGLEKEFMIKVVRDEEQITFDLEPTTNKYIKTYVLTNTQEILRRQKYEGRRQKESP